jgi:ribosomal silencing factor RsfS
MADCGARRAGKTGQRNPRSGSDRHHQFHRLLRHLHGVEHAPEPGQGELPSSLEGYEQGEWILADYGDFLVHVFSPKAREYYSLERLWRDGKDVPLPEEKLPGE